MSPIYFEKFVSSFSGMVWKDATVERARMVERGMKMTVGAIRDVMGLLTLGTGAKTFPDLEEGKSPSKDLLVERLVAFLEKRDSPETPFFF